MKNIWCLFLLFFTVLSVSETVKAQTLPGTYHASWVGNTYGKGGRANSPDGKWIQNYIDCMYVDEDGVCYTASIWDEGGRTHGKYKEGVALGNEKRAIDCKTAAGFTIITRRIPNLLGREQGYEDIGIKIIGNGKEITDCGNASAIAMGRNQYSGKLLVADNGPKKQILIYDVSGSGAEAVLVEKIGVEGGIGADYIAPYAIPASKNAPAYPAGRYKPGEYHPYKFWTLTGVGMDNSGRLFVSTSELGSSIRCFKKDAQSRWMLDWTVQNFMFVDNANPDETTDGIDVYTPQERFTINYNNREQGSEWTIKSVTVDAVKYPMDPRGLIGVKAGHEHGLTTAIIRYIDGKRFLFMNGMTCQWIFIFRFEDDSDIAVPSAAIMASHRMYDIKPDVFWLPHCPRDGKQYIWRDLNGDGDYQANEYTLTDMGYNGGISAFWVDSKGGIWVSKGTTVQRYIPKGIDDKGNPIYDDSNTEKWDIKNIDRVGRLVWQEDKDRLVLVDTACRNLVGGSIYVVNHWSSGNRTAEKLSPLKGPNPSSATAAGDYFFEVGWQSRGEVFITDLNTGKMVGSMVPSDEAGTVEYTGWVDIAYGIDAIQRSTGEYIVFVEEDYMGKVLMYRWNPAGETMESDIGIELQSPSNLSKISRGSSVQINANIVSGTPVKVQLILETEQGEQVLSEKTTAPYQYSWVPVEDGYYRIYAKAFAANGGIKRTKTSNIYYGGGLPLCNLSCPNDKDYFTFDEITFLSTVSGHDIDRVEFFVDNVQTSLSENQPYTFQWTNPPEGTHTIHAVAYDKNGKSGKSKEITINISDFLEPVQTGSLIPGVSYNFYNQTINDAMNIPALEPYQTGISDDFTSPKFDCADYGNQYVTYMDIPTEGKYTFYVDCKDGALLYIDDLLVVNHNRIKLRLRETANKIPYEKSGDVLLKAGNHKITILHFNKYSSYNKAEDGFLAISISGPDMDKKRIPKNMLFTR